ncbi:MAG: HAMP domain-containing histidine kinase [Magnetococcales bacterium]|nr:HAMP domain-containing histidine kinase [Magnetococcales bacterium]
MSQNSLQEIVENTTGIHWAILNASGVIVAVNGAWRSFSQLNGGFGDYVGVNYLDICTRAGNRNGPLWEARLMAQSLKEYLDGQQQIPRSLSYSCHSPQEHRWFEATLQPCQWQNQQHLLILHRNITQQKLLECSQERAMAMMLHDLRNPIGGTHNICAMLLNLDLPDEERTELLQLGLDSTKRALDIITTATRFTALERGNLHLELEALNLPAMIEQWQRQQKESLDQRRQRLIAQINPHPQSSRPRGERHLIQSMLDNLLTNAMEAAPPESTLQVTLTVEPTGTWLTIRNPGAVPIAIRSHFFEKYVSWGKKSGTGLGTYSARLIVEAHRGTITMTTPDDTHTELLIFLPPP